MTELRLRRAQTEARAVLRRFGVENEAPVPIEDVAHALGVEIVHGGLRNALAAFTRVGDRRRIRLGERHDYPTIPARSATASHTSSATSCWATTSVASAT